MTIHGCRESVLWWLLAAVATGVVGSTSCGGDVGRSAGNTSNAGRTSSDAGADSGGGAGESSEGGSAGEDGSVVVECPLGKLVAVTGPACGDGQLDVGEMCDDGNVSSGDGCSSQCRIDDGWSCPDVG
jgi:cysteine-rich repeat protein